MLLPARTVFGPLGRCLGTACALVVGVPVAVALWTLDLPALMGAETGPMLLDALVPVFRLHERSPRGLWDMNLYIMAYFFVLGRVFVKFVTNCYNVMPPSRKVLREGGGIESAPSIYAMAYFLASTKVRPAPTYVATRSHL
jgi:hypothetical protein